MTVETTAQAKDDGAGIRRPNYQRIIVALDGSPLAEAVLPFVEPLAHAFGAEMTIVHAHPPLESTFTGGMEMGGFGMGGAVESIYEADEAIERADASYLGMMRKRLSRQGLTVHTAVPRMRAAEGIVAVALRTHADLIAMTTHGRSGIGRALLGSVADEVLRHAPCPVLLVHPHDA